MLKYHILNTLRITKNEKNEGKDSVEKEKCQGKIATQGE